jgi:hypothetical protein
MNAPEDARTIFETGKRLYLARPGQADDALMAAAYFERAALMGFAPAQRVLGIMCLEGDLVDKDPAKAARWLAEAAAQDDAQACFRLAVMCAKGESLPKDWSRAYELLSRPGVAALPEARELRRRLRNELIGLYPALAKAIADREGVYRAALDRHQRRSALPYLDPALDLGDRQEFEAWLGLNLGRLSAEAALGVIAGRLDDYYRRIVAPSPSAGQEPPCP